MAAALPSAPSTLLERDHELQQLTQAWSEARTAYGSLVFVRAEAGGGKSRLAAAIAATAGNAVLWGTAEPVAPPEPYLAILQTLPGFDSAAVQGSPVEHAIRLFGGDRRAGADRARRSALRR